MTAKQKHKLGSVLLGISTVVMLLNIVLKNHGIPYVKLLGLPLFFIGFLLFITSSGKGTDPNSE